jgi:3-hydroxymyristoyl/3-hydroxydecanoyl-(acyl carrier protein) dehydratase
MGAYSAAPLSHFPSRRGLPLAFVDRVLALDEGRIRALCAVTRNDAVLRGYPTVPASLVLGALVHAAVLLIAHARPGAGPPELAAANDVVFHGPVRVGEILLLDAWLEGDGTLGHRVGVRARVDDDIRAEGRLELVAPL